jgi:S-adenosylmethionine synthetase
MFGYACNETEAYPEHQGRWMPLAIALSQALTRRVSKVGLDGTLPWARPDAKSQVTLMHGSDGQPLYADNVVIAVQHKDMIGEHGSEEAEQAYIRQQVIEHVIRPVVPSSLMIEGKTTIHINSTGRFADPGGPYADAGLTGRKIIVDTYGGRGRHGGGAFSGKDPTKVDRSAAYAARWAAKHVVAAGLSTECEIQLAYAIGVADPVSIRVDTFGTGALSDDAIGALVGTHFSFKPGHIIKDLGLAAPIYGTTAAGGHFGRRPEGQTFPWEKLNQTVIEAFQSAV